MKQDVKQVKVYCDKCKHFIISNRKKNLWMQCKFKHNKVRGFANIFCYDCKDKEVG